MPTRFSVEYEGRRIEIVPESWWSGDRVRLLIDGDQVADAKSAGADTVVQADGILVRAVVPWHGTTITRAELVRDEGEPLSLEPEPGSRAPGGRSSSESGRGSMPPATSPGASDRRSSRVLARREWRKRRTERPPAEPS